MPRSNTALGQVVFSQLRRCADMVHLPHGKDKTKLALCTTKREPCRARAMRPQALFASAGWLLRGFHVLLRGLADLQEDPGQRQSLAELIEEHLLVMRTVGSSLGVAFDKHKGHRRSGSR